MNWRILLMILVIVIIVASVLAGFSDGGDHLWAGECFDAQPTPTPCAEPASWWDGP